MAVYQTKPGGGLFGNIGSMLASVVTGPMAPWIMAANAIYNGAKGDWGNAVVSGLGAYNGFNPAAPSASGTSSAASPGLSANGGTGSVRLGAFAPRTTGVAESVPNMWEPYDPRKSAGLFSGRR